MKREHMKNMTPITEPPTVEEFAAALRKDGGGRNVSVWGLDKPYLTATLRSDGSKWQWDRAEGFRRVK